MPTVTDQPLGLGKLSSVGPYSGAACTYTLLPTPGNTGNPEKNVACEGFDYTYSTTFTQLPTFTYTDPALIPGQTYCIALFHSNNVGIGGPFTKDVDCIGSATGFVATGPAGGPGTVSSGPTTDGFPQSVSPGHEYVLVLYHKAPEFAYVTNGGSNNVSAYAIDAASGALSPVAGSPFPAGTGPEGVAVDPSGKFAYVTNSGANNVSAYTINPASGVLSPVAGSPFVAGTGPEFVAVDHTGKFAYVTNVGSKNVSAYAINPASGALTPVVGSPFASGNNPRGVTVDPSGKFVYVVDEYDNNVSAYTIDRASGALTPVAGSPFATGGSFPFGVAVDPSGRFAYVVNGGNDCNPDCESVSAYTVNAGSGALTLMAGSPFAAGLYSSGGVAVEPSGRFVYVTSEQGGSIYAYNINPGSGALTQVSGSPFVGGNLFVAVDSSGKFAYSTSSLCNCVFAEAINANSGALTQVAGSPFATGASPSGIAVTP